MLCSLEVRAPFLDQRVIDFAYHRVPNCLRVTLTDRKILLKTLARRLLPAELDIDRKQGFTIPTSKWLSPKVVDTWREECHQQIRSVLSEAAVATLKRQRNLAEQHGLYAAMMLTSWMREYGVST
jgi:asparagine synthase (glutamine-hydrolysing)